MIGHLDDDNVKAIVDETFGENAMPCCSPTHRLAHAAHRIITLEIRLAWPTVPPSQSVDTAVDKVWNSQRPTHVKAVQSALWRATWHARDAGYIDLRAGVRYHD